MNAPVTEQSLRKIGNVVRRIDHHLPGWRLRRALRRQVCRLPGASLAPLVDGHTWLSRHRLKSLERHVKQIHRDSTPGAFVECGVGAGGSAALLAMWARRTGKREVFLFDTFEGLPPPTSDDPDYETAAEWTGRCRGTVEEVRALLTALDCDLRHVTFIQGMFQQTIPTWRGGPIALLHLDGDWYDSIRVCLEGLWDAISPGGFVQFDDYHIWQGCRRAVDEFVEARQLEGDLQHVDHAAWLRKRAK